MSGNAPTNYLDPKVRAAQDANARRMDDRDLLREIAVTEQRPEQPPIRVRWLEVLNAERDRRGL